MRLPRRAARVAAWGSSRQTTEVVAAAGEAVERGLDGGEVAPVVEVVGLDVGDHRHLGVELGEGAVALVGLHHEQVAGVPRRARAEGVDVAADDERRREPGLLQDQGQHRRGRGLAVGARHGERPAHPGDGGQGLGPVDDEGPGLARGAHLGVGPGDGGGHHHHVDPLDVGRGVAHLDLDALRGEALEPGRGLHVGAADPVAHAGQHRGDGPHADAADPDDVDPQHPGGEVECVVSHR